MLITSPEMKFYQKEKVPSHLLWFLLLFLPLHLCLEGSCQRIFPRDAGMVLPDAHTGIVSPAVAAPVAAGLVSALEPGRDSLAS